MKWMDYLQAFTFSIKHKKWVANKVDDASSRRNLAIQEIQMESVGISAKKDMYANDEDFNEAYQVCLELGDRYHTDFADYIIQEGLLFKGSLLCIPLCSMRDNIIREKHCGSVAGHFC